MSNELIAVPFHGDVIEATKDEMGVVLVPLRRPCEALGLDYSAQLQKLKSKAWAGVVLIPIHDPTGRMQDTNCIPLDSLPMWLATIEASRVNEKMRPKLELYQKDAARVLAEHFLGPKGAPSVPNEVGPVAPRKPRSPKSAKAAGKGMMSVYPPKEVGPILGGYRSVPLSNAIRRDAERIAVGAIKLQTVFAAQDWELLYRALSTREWAPELPNPGEMLAHALERAHLLDQTNDGKENSDDRIQAVAVKLRGCNYDEASAVIIALNFRREHSGHIAAGDAWWTIGYRAAKMRPEQTA